MNKKKVILMVGLVIFICVVLFLGFTIRKMVILDGLAKKVETYAKSDNYYEKIVNESASTKTVTEYYCKGNNAVLFLNTTVKSTGQTRVLMNYYKGDKANSYFNVGEQKVAILDSQGIGRSMILAIDYDDDLWLLFQMAATMSIRTEEWNGKECYVVTYGRGSNETVNYHEKETGLIIKAKEGTQTDENGNTSDCMVEYTYEFGNVQDSVFVEPDLVEYKIEE